MQKQGDKYERCKINYITIVDLLQEMARAAERRMKDQETRGIQNPDSVRRKQERSLEQERIERETAGQTGQTLRWAQD